MTLPLYLILENHWDVTAKRHLEMALPALNEAGYDTLCVESPHDRTAKAMIDSCKKTVENDGKLYAQAKTLLEQRGITQELSDMPYEKLVKLIHLYVSSKFYIETTERLLSFRGAKVMSRVLALAGTLGVEPRGVDIVAEDYSQIVSEKITCRMPAIERSEGYRVNVIVQNLLKLIGERTGVVFLCGAGHGPGLQAMFAKHSINVVSCFPYGPKIHTQIASHAPEILIALKNCLCVLSEDQIPGFSKKMVEKITAQIPSTSEILGGTANSRFLSAVFGETFIALERPGHYVDGLAESGSSKIKAIKKGLHAVSLPFHTTVYKTREYLVVSGINTRGAAEKIKQLG